MGQNPFTLKYVKRNTCPGKCEGDIDIEAEEFIKQKLKHIIIDGDVDVKTKELMEQKDNTSKKDVKDDVYVDVKAEEFIKQKKSELGKIISFA